MFFVLFGVYDWQRADKMNGSDAAEEGRSRRRKVNGKKHKYLVILYLFIFRINYIIGL